MPRSALLSRQAALTALPALVLALLAGCASQGVKGPRLTDGARARVAILETTDIHANELSYDYYKLAADPTLGFERTATLIQRARAEFPNSFLFDDGDTIQGSVLGDYQAHAKPLPCTQELAIYRAMDALGYDGGTVGNHDFDDGLGFLAQVTGTPMRVDGRSTPRCAGPLYPLVLANVVGLGDGAPIFRPWTVVSKTIEVDNHGKHMRVPLRIGIIGFTPPPIMQWDKQQLSGRISVSGVVEAAQRYLPQLQAQHPDLIVALVHGGLDIAPYTASMENGGWYLAGVPGIDVLLLGHVHTAFPGPFYAGLPQVDAQRGFVRGKPAVMGGFFGKDLGVIALALQRRDGRWVIDHAATHSEVRPICPGDASANERACVPADPAIAPLVAGVHRAAIAYVDTRIGSTRRRLSSYFADEGNLSALAPINAAQADYVRRELPQLHPELRRVPVLSAAAAFRTGLGRPGDYTDIAPGPLTLRSAADLYFYPNTLVAVKIDGDLLKAWLERSAERFNRIDPARRGAQALINDHTPGFNFDQIQGGIRYVIDVSRPVGRRITSLTFHGTPVTPTQPFIVVTNSYRANGGGQFPGLDGSNIVLVAADGTRQILARWIKRRGQLRAADLEASPWRFAPLHARGPLVFTGASGKQAIARGAGLTNIRQLKDRGDGTALYAIDLSR
jgi:2',3'-cyclic-nucleotide 2'-phosphodiesterase/3'-nucleotidase